jgi:transposase
VPNRRTSLKKIRKLLKSITENVRGSRRLSEYSGISHTKVATLIKKFERSGFTFQELLDLDDSALDSAIHPQDAKPKPKKKLPDYEAIDKALCRGKKNGVTRTLLWQEYIEQNPDGYGLSQFNEHYRRFRKQKKKSEMHQDRIPGERLYEDYSGLKMFFVNRETGEKHDCELFVTALGLSGKIYTEATLTQQIPDWLASNENAFHYYGGVPWLMIPDCLKSAIIKGHRYDPINNKTFEAFCDHYGTAILAARPREPRDKGLVENAVKMVQMWIVAPLRNRTFFSLQELNEAIWEKLELFNNREFSAREGSRQSQFEEFDLPALKPLPAKRFEYADWKVCKVGPGYHIQYKKNQYSVHHNYKGKKVDVRVTASGVEIFYKNKRIASHMRLKGKGKYSTYSEHMPPEHLAYKKMPSTVREWLESLDGSAVLLARKMYKQEKHPSLSVRLLLGMMGLEKKYGKEPFQKACGYVLRYETSYRYNTVSNTLKHELYSQTELPFDEENESTTEHENIRGGSYFV